MSEQFDLETHVLNRYAGEARLQRLLFIARNNYRLTFDDSLVNEDFLKSVTSATTTTSGATSTRGTHELSSSSSSSLLSLGILAYESAVHYAVQQNNAARYKDIFHTWNQQQELELERQNHQRAGVSRTLDVSSARSASPAGVGGVGNVGSMASIPSTKGSSSGSGIATSSYDLMELYDERWYQETILNNRSNLDVLKSRLQASQAHLNKEAIRVAYLALAEFEVRTGNLNKAFHAVYRAKDYCTTRHQTTAVTLQILMYAILLRNYDAIRIYVPRLEHTLATGAPAAVTSTRPSGNPFATSSSTIPSPGGTNSAASTLDPSMQASVLNCVLIASGLEKLAMCDYQLAAAKFRAVAMSGHNNATNSSSSSTTALGGTTSESSISASAIGGASSDSSPTDWDTNVLAPEDTASYAAFLTLAMEDNRSVVMALAEDAEALELVPHMKEVLIQFTRLAQYKLAFGILERHVLPILKHDLYLSHHLPFLTQKIRDRAIVQYWKPYQKIELSLMASELGDGIIQPRRTTTGASTNTHSGLHRPTLNQHHASSSTNDSSLCSSQALLLLETLMQLMTTNRSALGHDTRIDLRSNALVRDDSVPELHERFIQTSTKLQITSHRLLNDTYSMMIKASCIEQGMRFTDQAGSKRSKRGDSNSIWSTENENDVDSDQGDDYGNDDYGVDDQNDEIIKTNTSQHDNEDYSDGAPNDIDDNDDECDAIANEGGDNYHDSLEMTVDSMNPEDMY